MTAVSVIVICVIVLAVLVLICAVARWWDRNGENKAYDERQLAEQGRARAVADTVGLVYFLFLFVFLTYERVYDRSILPADDLVLVGLLLHVMTYHIYCVMTDASLPFGQNPKVTIFWAVAAGLVQFGNCYMNHRQGGDDQGVGLLNLIAGVAFFFLALLHLIALLRKEKE